MSNKDTPVTKAQQAFVEREGFVIENLWELVKRPSQMNDNRSIWSKLPQR